MPDLPPALVLMAREPVPGRVKTRLIPAIGERGAASLFAAFAADRLRAHQNDDAGCRLYLACTPFPAPALETIRDEHGPGFEMIPQEGADLAERMDGLFADLLGRGHAAVVMTNCDSPQLGPSRVRAALESLTDPDTVVLGPDHGGGYYLVALARPCPGLFAAADGSGSSRERTVAFAKRAGRPVRQLPAMLDVDLPADLDRLRALLRERGAGYLPNSRRALDRLTGPGPG